MAMSEIEYRDGVPIVPNVHPVLILQGTDFEIGSQYVQQLHEIYGDYALERFERGFTEEEEAAVEEWAAYLRKYTPEFDEILKGAADAAGRLGFDLEYKHFLAEVCNTMSIHGRAPLPTYPGTETGAEEPQLKNCSGFAAWGSATKDGKVICGGSADHVVDFDNIVACYPETGNNMIFRFPLELVSLGMFPGMNNKGVAYAHHGSGILGNEKPGYSVFGVAQLFHTLRFANSAEEALEMQASYPAGTRADGLWVDVNGNAGVLECRDPKTIRRPGECGEEDFLHATNTVMSKSLEPFIVNPYGWPVSYVEHGGWLKDELDSERRNLCMWNALHNYHGEIDLEFAKMLFRMGGPEPEYDSIQEAERGLYETQGKGWMPYVGNLANISIAFVEPDAGDKGTYHVCTGVSGKNLEPLSDEWYFFNTDELRTYFELTLAASPTEMVQAAKSTCDYAMFYANRALSKLTIHDLEWAPMTKVFNKAAAAYQKGDFFLTAARDMEGMKAVNQLSKALRFYVRCQALSRHVTETLEGAPSCPSDLGLRPWLGDWGEWDFGPETA